MRLLFAAAEAFPLAKVGGLADVVGSLPKALLARGHQVALILPRYQVLNRVRSLEMTSGNHPLSVRVFGQEQPVKLRQTVIEDLPIYLVENDFYFNRPAIYGEADDLARFFFFSQAVIAALDRLPWLPEVIHAHDWHTGLIPLWAKERGLASVFTIHNLAYQGAFGLDFLAASKLNEYHETSPVHLPHNILAWGIWHATKVNTVSPKYAEEIQNPELGEGLDGLLRQRRADLTGIVNGIDYGELNPANDPLLPANYDASALKGKAVCKAELQKRMGLPQTADTPLIGMVSRMDDQKGFDLLPQAIEQIFAQTPAQMVILGRGRPHYEVAMKELAARYADRLGVAVAFDNPLAHLIYAGADFFLMPSRFEPCGLGQLVAMHYGTVPIVRHTGGLSDTVPPLSLDLKEGRGFIFQEYTSQALAGAVQQATEAFGHRQGWAELQARLMRLDFSWTASAQRYEEVYQQALKTRPSPHP